MGANTIGVLLSKQIYLSVFFFRIKSSEDPEVIPIRRDVVSSLCRIGLFGYNCHMTIIQDNRLSCIIICKI